MVRYVCKARALSFWSLYFGAVAAAALLLCYFGFASLLFFVCSSLSSSRKAVPGTKL